MALASFRRDSWLSRDIIGSSVPLRMDRNENIPNNNVNAALNRPVEAESRKIVRRTSPVVKTNVATVLASPKGIAVFTISFKVLALTALVKKANFLVAIAPERANVIKLPIRNTTHTSRRLRPRDNRRREIPTVTDRSTIVTKAGYSKRSKARKIELNVFAYEEMTLALPRSIVTLLANGSANTIWVATQSATRAIATRRSRRSATVVR